MNKIKAATIMKHSALYPVINDLHLFAKELKYHTKYCNNFTCGHYSSVKYKTNEKFDNSLQSDSQSDKKKVKKFINQIVVSEAVSIHFLNELYKLDPDNIPCRNKLKIRASGK